MKRLLSPILVLAMLLALAIPAGAVEVPESTGATLEEVDSAVSAAGGTPGQINVMWMGKCIAFPDAAPELTNNRTMVPVRAIMEDMGAEVTFDENQLVTCSLNGVTTSFTVGSTEATVEKDGKTETVTMDSPSYLKDNRTYVPVRFISEASGYDVFWDSVARTAVIVDREAVVKGLDENLTIYNEILQKQYDFYDLSKAYEMNYTMDGSATLYDTVSGNQTYTADGQMSILWKGSDYEVSGSLNLEQILDVLMKNGLIAADAYPQEVMDQMKNLEFGMILSSQGYWMNIPLLTYLMAGDPAAQLPEGSEVWLDMGAAAGLDMGSLMGMTAAWMEDGATIGSLLYDTAMAATEAMGQTGQLSYLTFYQQMGMAKTLLDTLVGDDTFTRMSTGYRWSLELEDLMGLASSLTGMPMELPEGVTFEMEMTVKASGASDFSLQFAMDDVGDGVTSVVVKADGTSGADKGGFNCTLQVKNFLDAKVSMDYTCKATSRTPAVQPPAGSTILDPAAGL